MTVTVVRVEDFGALETNNGTQNAAAFAAAISALSADGGTVRFSGRYVVDQIVFPNDPKVVNLIGDGIDGCELIMGTPAGPLITKTSTDGRITGARMAHFTVRAHANSEKTNLGHIALALSGWGASQFDNIRYTGSTEGIAPTGSVGIFIEQVSSSRLTYNNVFRNIVIRNCFGPSRALYCGNGGTGFLGNTNNIELHDSWFYGCAGIDVVFDGYDSTRSAVVNNLFENCANTTAVTLGQSCHVARNWFESIGTSIASSASASVDGSAAVIMSNYFSGAGAVYLEPMGAVPLWIGNAGGGQTFTGPVKPAIIAAPVPAPAAPTLTLSSGTATLIGSTVALVPDVTGRVTFHLRYACTPAATGAATLTVITPTGYDIEQAEIGATRLTTGKPALCAVAANASGGVYGLWFDAVDAHEIDARVTLMLKR